METAIGKTREETINKLADRIDAFERYSQPHSRLMAELATVLATRLGLSDHDIDAISEAALLHDIGLYAMAPTYHASPGPLSFEQRLDLWRHPVVGEQQMAKREASRYAQLLVRWHHEWWNGSGYPDALAFEDIPIGARILRAAELLCSLLVDRPYRGAFSEADTAEILKSSAGVECDPYVVRVLISLLEEIKEDEPHQQQAHQQGLEPETTRVIEQRGYPSLDPAQATTAASDLQTPEAVVESASMGPVDFAGALSSSDGNAGSSAESKPDGDWGGLLSSAAAGEPQAGSPGPQSELILDPSPPQFMKFPGSSVPSDTDLPAVSHAQPPAPLPPASRLLSRLVSLEHSKDAGRWTDWGRSRYIQKSLLGFEASVLRQLEFRSIAMPFSGATRLDLYLKTWGKHIFANDPRAWSATIARAIYETHEPLSETQIASIVEDVYVPRARLTNPGLRRWFGETDAWWMDNLRRNIESIEDETLRAQALMIGMQIGDYALSFNEETHDLRVPLTTLFWRMAGRALVVPGNSANRAFHLQAEDFIRHARADLLYLSLPPGRPEGEGPDARFDWRESWVLESSQRSEQLNQLSSIESRRSYLLMVDRLLKPASHVKTWAIGCQEIGLATAQDIIEVIKEHRHVRATYSKDVSEVAGGARSYIIVADKTQAR